MTMASSQGFRTALLVLCVIGSFTTMANESETALKAVAKSNTEFTSSLYNALTQVVDGNLIFSPYSLSAVMAMVKAGAKGRTANDIQTAMKYPTDDNTLFKGYKALLESLKSDGQNFTLETVNRVYAKTGFKLQSRFTSIVEENFGAKIEQLDFTKSSQAASTINDFVARTTHDKIKDLISPGDLDSLTRLVLVNAIYFKGLWKNQFNKQLTKEADFHLNKNDTVKVQMMKIEADFPYGEIEELNAKAIALPYQGDRLSMIILLPNEIEGLKDMEEKLKNFSLASIPSRLRERKINLSMPKFTLESTIDLKGPLTAIGAGSIFDETKADFSGIPEDKSEQLYVSKAVQKAFIEVNEEGSEAAAATVAVMRGRALVRHPQVTLSHPFFFTIMKHKVEESDDGKMKAIPPMTTLFGGRCTDPPSSSKPKRGESKAEEEEDEN
ncbi:leukocyte elastase inhibitor isoform X4 [Folsomia candida]|uniref:leukocyte elastase inhibitor isoform X4 n=1 Tax=Folsomia candida TaxID=158441 RepID=UPI000B8FD1BE|nr:leukocyte elastase inhibitor isoform X4 [Folsomia candida]